MTQKLTFGNPWMGQNDRKAIDAAPGVCVAQNNIWLGRSDVLQRRPAMAAYTVTGSSPVSNAYGLIPVNVRMDYDPEGMDSHIYNPMLLFMRSDGINNRYGLVYHSTDETVVVCNDPMVLQNMRTGGSGLPPNGRCAAVAGMPGQQTMMFPTCPVSLDQSQYTADPYVLFVESRHIPDSDTEKSQLMKVRSDATAMPTLTKTSGGSLLANNYYWIRYRFELVDAQGIMRMCSDWSTPIGVVMGPTNETAITVTTPYYYGTFTQNDMVIYGIGYNAAPTTVNDLEFHWDIRERSNYWTYRIRLARTQGASTNAYSAGPYYLAETAKLSDLSSHIALTTTMADTDLTTEYDQWEDMAEATDVISLNSVYVWVKNLAWNHDGLWWGTNEYPYLAYPSNWISIEKGSFLVKLDASTVACVGNRKLLVVSNLPDTPSVSEYPLPAVISRGAVWNATYSSGTQSVFGQGTDGRVYDLINRIAVTDVVPWLVDDRTKTYRSQATFLGDLTVIQKWNETDSTCTSYAVRQSDNTIWRLSDGTMATSHYENNNENLFRVLNQIRQKSGQYSIYYSTGAAVSALADTNADATTEPISSYWQSAWQSCGTTQIKQLRGVECRQEISSQCTVLVECTDHPAAGAERSITLTFTDPRDLKSFNLLGKYFRIKISSIDGQLWNVNDVSVYYDVATTKNGLQ